MLVTTKKKYDALMRDLLEQEDLFAIDTETEDFIRLKLHPWETKVKGVGIYTKKTSAYILPELLDDKFQRLLDSKVTIWHNFKYDASVLEYAGFDLSKTFFHDTLVMAWVANENRTSYKLKDLAQSVLGVKEVTHYDDLAAEPEQGTAEYTRWLEAIAVYCQADAEYTYKLFAYFRKKLVSDNVWRVYNDLERPLVDVIRRMEMAGINIDVPYLERMKVKLEKRIEEVTKEVYAEAGGKFNIGSATQLSQILFDVKGYKLPDDYLTPGGKLSTNVRTLDYISQTYKCPLVEKVLEFRELSKILSTYVVGLLERQKNGVIHTSFRQTGTVTGRLSSANPNLQNMPRGKVVSDCCGGDVKSKTCQECGQPCKEVKWEFDIRGAFVPREGNVFVLADYSQIELRLLAYFSGCKPMIEAYKNGADIHQATADILGCDRFMGKTINFSIVYGITGYGLGKRIKMDEDEAQKFIDNYLSKFPEVLRFIQEAKDMLRKDYAVRTLIGRKRRFPDYAAARKRGEEHLIHRMERQAGNAIIQGTAADIVKIAMKRLDAALKPHKATMLVQVHDEVIVECPKEEADAVMAIVQKEMEGAVELEGVSMVAEPKIADRWVK